MLKTYFAVIKMIRQQTNWQNKRAESKQEVCWRRLKLLPVSYTHR